LFWALQVFLPSNQGQLGLEGFIMGFMYLLFGLTVASLTFAVPKLADPSHRRTAAYVCIVFAGLVFKQIVDNYTWKTGKPLSLVSC
jgi:oligosaccharyltransferase complex subunit gamma